MPSCLQVVSSYPLDGANPYWRLFYQALAANGIKCIGTGSTNPSWLESHSNVFDAFHVHIVEHIGRFPPPRLVRLLPFPTGIRGAVARRLFWPVEVLGFRSFLRKCRARGVRLVWTLHNLESHEQPSFAEQAAHRLLARYADLVICHSQWSAEKAIQRYNPSGRIVIMPYGNYDGVFPESPSRAETLRGLGLDPTLPVVSCLGQVRRYKGVDLACDAVSRLGGRVQLVIAGDLHPDLDAFGMRERVSQLSVARLIARRLSDGEYAALVRASDAILLPYLQITGSSAMLAALTLGRGVITADLPPFQEVLCDYPAAGERFRVGDVNDLRDAIDRYLKVPHHIREQAARNLAASYSWNRVIRPVAEAMAQWKLAE